MDGPASLLALLEKLGHPIVDIRDRAMRSFTRKVLSPILTRDLIDVLTEHSKLVARRVLEWINDRYDCVDSQLIDDCLRMTLVIISRSEHLRQGFVDAGGVTFFDEFSNHNKAYEEECDELVSDLLQVPSVSLRNSRLRHVVRESLIEEFFQPLEELSRDSYMGNHSTSMVLIPGSLCSRVSSDQMQQLFDLSVRIKFFNSTNTPHKSVREVYHMVKNGIGGLVPGSVFVSHPFLIDALCGNLRNGTGGEGEIFAILLLHVLDRIVGSIEYVSLEKLRDVVGTVLVTSMELVVHTRHLIHFGIYFIERCLVLMGHNELTAVGWAREYFVGSSQSAAILLATSKMVTTVFPSSEYMQEKFDFGNGEVVYLKRWRLGWTDPLFPLCARMVVGVLFMLGGENCGSKNLLLDTLSDWVGEERFVRSVGSTVMSQAHQILGSSLTSVTHQQSRELLVSFKKFKCKEYLTRDNLVDLLEVEARVSGILGEKTDVAQFFLRSVLSLEDVELLKWFVARDEGYCEGFLGYLQDFLEGWSAGTSADTSALSWIFQSPRSMVELVAAACTGDQGVSLGRLFNSVDSSVFIVFSKGPSLLSQLQSLFSLDEAERRTAALLVWKRFITDDMVERGSYSFVNDPLRQIMLRRGVGEKFGLKDPGAMTTDPLRPTALSAALRAALETALNPRLDEEVRLISCDQVMNLLGKGSKDAPLGACDSPLINWSPVLTGLSSRCSVSLYVSLCRSVALAVTYGAVDEQADDPLLSFLAKQMFSPAVEMSVASLLLLGRIVFGRLSLCGVDVHPTVYLRVVKKFSNRLFDFVGLEEDMAILVGEAVETLSSVNSRVALPAVALFVAAVTSSDKESNSDGIADPLNMTRWSLEQRTLVCRESGDCAMCLLQGLSAPPPNEELYWSLMVEKVLPLLRLQKRGWSDDDRRIVPDIAASLQRVAEQCLADVEAGSEVPAWYLCEVLDWLGRHGFNLYDMAQKFLHAIRPSPAVDLSVAKLTAALIPSYQGVVDHVPHEPAHLVWLFVLWLKGERVPNEMFKQCMASHQSVYYRALLWLLADGVEAMDILVDGGFTDGEATDRSLLFVGVCQSLSRVARGDMIAPAVERLERDLVDSVENVAPLVGLLAAVVVRDITQASVVCRVLIERGIWGKLFAQSCGVELATLCLEESGGLGSRLANYFAQTGIFFAFEKMHAKEICAALRLLWDLGGETAVNPVGVPWMKKFVERPKTTDLPLLTLVSDILLQLKMSANASASIESLILDNATLTSVEGCECLCQLARINSGSLSQPTIAALTDLMDLHNRIAVSETQIFCAQIRLVSACSGGSFSAYSAWFVSVWRRSIAAKDVSYITLTELASGLIEVLHFRERKNFASLIGPVSEVLSLATKKDAFPKLAPSFLSLCLSVGEAAYIVLAKRAVTGRVVQALVGLHANTLHAKNISKDDLARAAAVIKFSASVIGCPFVAAEVTGELADWIESSARVVDEDVFARLIGSTVLAKSTNNQFRHFICTACPSAITLLEKRRNEECAIAKIVLEYLRVERN